MKKLMISLAIGAVALGATVVPANAGTGGYIPPHVPTQSIWEILVGASLGTEGAKDVDGTTIGFSDLVLIAGLGSTLDECGNGKPFYTLFAPIAPILTYLLGPDGMNATMVDLAGAPEVVKAILADHLVNGSFSPEQLAVSKRLVARSGYILNIQKIKSLYVDVTSLPPTTSVTDFYVNGNQITNGLAGCNGWVYTLLGFVNSKDYVVSEGMNALDTPQDGTPGGTNSLPNTL